MSGRITWYKARYELESAFIVSDPFLHTSVCQSTLTFLQKFVKIFFPSSHLAWRSFFSDRILRTKLSNLEKKIPQSDTWFKSYAIHWFWLLINQVVLHYVRNYLKIQKCNDTEPIFVFLDHFLSRNGSIHQSREMLDQSLTP